MRGRSGPGRQLAPCRVPAGLAHWRLDGAHLNASADDVAGQTIAKSPCTQVAARTASQSWYSLNANVCFWHIADIPRRSTNVRFWGQSGRKGVKENIDETGLRNRDSSDA